MDLSYARRPEANKVFKSLPTAYLSKRSTEKGYPANSQPAHFRGPTFWPGIRLAVNGAPTGAWSLRQIRPTGQAPQPIIFYLLLHRCGGCNLKIGYCKRQEFTRPWLLYQGPVYPFKGDRFDPKQNLLILDRKSHLRVVA